eukprot:m.392407 g.392407  ORF g.392407 m.392407 type:complete len:214 (+) comp28323_c0_seq9:743-1384(+)
MDEMKDAASGLGAGDPAFVDLARERRKQLSGAAMRQYEDWLASVDKTRDWGGLGREVDDDTDTVIWVLPDDATASASAAGPLPAVAGAAQPAVLYQGDVCVKRSGKFSHQWHDAHWRLVANPDGSRELQHWRRNPGEAPDRPPLFQRSVDAPAPTICTVAAAYNARKPGKYVGVLQLIPTVGGEPVLFRPDVADPADAAVAASAWTAALTATP